MRHDTLINLSKRQFDIVLTKEGFTVSDYFDSTKTYNVFFRRNNRGTTPQGKLRLYYPQDCGISIGTIFKIKDVPYLVISQDGIESDVYRTSMAIVCDTTLSVSYNNSLVQLPISVDRNEYVVDSDKLISVVDGSVTIKTGDNKYSRAIEPNDEFNAFGGRYRVGNTFYNNNLAYVYMTREAELTTNVYSLIYSGITNIDLSVQTYQLTYTATKNGNTVDSPTITYATSDNTIATVSDTGVLTLLQAGDVTITATWTDGDDITTCTTKITITEGTISKGSVSIKGSSIIKVGGSARSYSAVYTDNDSNDVTSNVNSVWNITDFVDADGATLGTSLLTLDTSTQNKISIKVTDESTIGGTFTLNVTDTNGEYGNATLAVSIEER